MRVSTGQRRWRRWVDRLGLALAACLAQLALVAPANATSPEYDLKAAFLARFAEFIDWPQAPEEVFTLCVYGAHPIQAPLARLPGLVVVKGEPIEVRRVDTVAAATACRILFIPPEALPGFTGDWQRLGAAGVLTVSDSAGAPPPALMINFYHRGGHLRFQVHLNEARAAGLKISARLLKLATIVE